MDELNIYGSTSNDGRRIIGEADKQMAEPMEQDDQTQQRRTDRRTDRRTGRRCHCRTRRRSRRRRRQIRSQNPFIIYYLELYYQMPGRHVTEVARQAGKDWSAMSEEDKQRYVRLAERERRRRLRRLSRRGRVC